MIYAKKKESIENSLSFFLFVIIGWVMIYAKKNECNITIISDNTL
jgi:hypothetical protein